MYIFDEYDEYYRYPCGAIAAGGTLRLRLKLRRGECGYVKVIYNPDGCGTRETDMRFTAITGAYDVFETEISFENPHLYWFCFRVGTKDDVLYIDTQGAKSCGDNGFQVTVYDPGPTEPDWIHGGVIYHIFVDRFFRGKTPPRAARGGVLRSDWGGCPGFRPDEEGVVRNNDFFGGNLEGIIDKLPYLEELGVTCIYLSPIFEAASNHKYDTGDFMRIDPFFGDDELFERLCGEAGRRGMRIILDGVFNHVGVDSRYFNKYGGYDSLGAWQSRQSPYIDWFSFHEWNSVYESWWGIQLLPALNKRNEAYRDFICGDGGIISHWMKKGVSGWRLDVADELPDVFLDPLCEAIKREKSDALIIGEVWEDASNKISYGSRRRYLLGGQLDGVINYPLRDAIIACIKDKNIGYLAQTMGRICQNYPESALNSMMNILGTHDTMRILTALGGDVFPQTKEEMSAYTLSFEMREKAKKLLKAASALQFTLPGVPCVYYGDEAGMEGGTDPFNRRCYPWGSEEAELVRWYQSLARLRKDHTCFKDGEYTLLQAREGLFVFTRGQGCGRVLVAVNMTEEDSSLEYGEFNYDIINKKYSGKDECIVKSEEAAIYAIRFE